MNNSKIELRLNGESFFQKGQHIAARCKLHRKFPVHWHNYFEIEILSSGSGNYILNGKTYSIKRGSVFIMDPTDFHELNAETETEIYNISFDEQMLTDEMFYRMLSANAKKHIELSEEKLCRILQAFDLLKNECDTDGPCKRQLCEYIINYISRESVNSFSDLNPEQLSGIKKSILYLEMHFRERLSLNKLAKISGFNMTYFSELFKSVTGETYINRLTNLRIGYSKTLLSSGFSVSDSCYMSGFSSLSNFLSVFKKKCGITPSEYRKLNYKI